MGNNVTFQSDIFESRAVMAAQMARVNNSILHCEDSIIQKVQTKKATDGFDENFSIYQNRAILKDPRFRQLSRSPFRHHSGYESHDQVYCTWLLFWIFHDVSTKNHGKT